MWRGGQPICKNDEEQLTGFIQETCVFARKMDSPDVYSE
jgi:hypothetical protein